MESSPASAAESAIVDAVLQGDGAIGAARALVRPDDFRNGKLRSVFAAAMKVDDRGEVVDEITVGAELAREGALEPIGGYAYLAKISPGNTAPAAVFDYARIVLEAAKRRAGDRAATARAHLSALDTACVLPPLIETIEKPIKRVPSGWSRLDAFLGGGFVQSGFVILGGEPKSSKSTFAQIMAERHAAAGGCVYYLDQENGRQRFFRRALSRKAHLGGAQFGRNLTFEEHKRQASAREWASSHLYGRFYYDDTRRIQDGPSLRAQALRAREVAGDKPLLIVIDSLQKLPMADLRDRRAGVDGWLRHIEAMREEASAVVLAISELRRPSEGSKGYGEASAARLKESGDAEYTSDLILLFTKIAKGEEPAWETPCAEWRGPVFNLDAQCNRDGATGEVASYRTVFPYYGLEELELVRRGDVKPRGRSAADTAPFAGRLA